MKAWRSSDCCVFVQQDCMYDTARTHVCMYAYIHTYIHTYMHTYMVFHMYMHMHMYVCVFVCMYVYIYICVCVCVCVCECMYQVYAQILISLLAMFTRTDYQQPIYSPFHLCMLLFENSGTGHFVRRAQGCVFVDAGSRIRADDVRFMRHHNTEITSC